VRAKHNTGKIRCKVSDFWGRGEKTAKALRARRSAKGRKQGKTTETRRARRKDRKRGSRKPGEKQIGKTAKARRMLRYAKGRTQKICENHKSPGVFLASFLPGFLLIFFVIFPGLLASYLIKPGGFRSWNFGCYPPRAKPAPTSTWGFVFFLASFLPGFLLIFINV
jgi:hypothetical protein